MNRSDTLPDTSCPAATHTCFFFLIVSHFLILLALSSPGMTTVMRPCSSLHGLWPFGHWAGTTLSSSKRSAQVPRPRLERILKAFRKHRNLWDVATHKTVWWCWIKCGRKGCHVKPEGFSYVSAMCRQCVQDVFPEQTLSLRWGRLSSHSVYSAVGRRLNLKNYWTRRLKISVKFVDFSLFLSFSFSCHCFGIMSWSCSKYVCNAPDTS